MRAAVLALTWLLCQAPATRTLDPDDTVTLAGDLVLVPVAVRHDQGGFVTDLKIGELTVAEDGVPQQVAFFNLDTAPVDLALLVDVSGSIESELELIQTAAFSLIKQLRPEDRYSIVTFSDRPIIDLDWTDDRRRAAEALRAIRPSGSTALYGSVVAVSYERFTSRSRERRRAMVVLTDGDDTVSSVTSRTAARAALAHDVSVYVVSTGRLMAAMLRTLATHSAIPTEQRRQYRETAARLRRIEERMEHLAEQTGGRVLYPNGPGDLTKSFREIADEIRSRYLLGYYPPEGGAGGFRTITVATPRRAVRVHARQGYFREGAGKMTQTTISPGLKKTSFP